MTLPATDGSRQGATGAAGRLLGEPALAAAGRRFGTQALAPAVRQTLAALPRERTAFVLYAAYTILLFALSLVATFPHDLLVRRLLAGTADAPVIVDVSGVRLGWTLAYEAASVRLMPRDGDPTLPVLTATGVRAAPSLLGLLQGRVYPVGLRADLYGGTLTGTVDLSPRAFDVRAALAGVDVGKYEGLRLFMEGTLAGRIDGTIELHGDAAKPATTNGTVDVRAQGLALEGGKVRGIGVPDLHFPAVRVSGALKAGRLELAELVGEGREVTVGGRGNVLLQHPLATSLLNLMLTVRPAPEAPEPLRLALNLLPGEAGAGGEHTIRLIGSVRQPRVQ